MLDRGPGFRCSLASRMAVGCRFSTGHCVNDTKINACLVLLCGKKVSKFPGKVKKLVGMKSMIDNRRKPQFQATIPPNIWGRRRKMAEVVPRKRHGVWLRYAGEESEERKSLSPEANAVTVPLSTSPKKRVPMLPASGTKRTGVSPSHARRWSAGPAAGWGY